MSLQPTSPQWEIIKICMGARETRQGLDGYDQYHANLDEQLLKIVWMLAKPAEDWTNMAIFTENPPRIGRIWPYSPKTCRGLDEYGHIHRKPAEDGINMAIFTENSPRIGRIWPYSLKTHRGLDKYGHIYRKPDGNGMNMSTAIENPAGMGRIWSQLSKTRRGWDKYIHSFLFLGGYRRDEVRVLHILIEGGK